MSAEKTLKVALLGCGNVGSQVARLLREEADELAVRIGARLELAGIAVRRLSHPRPGIDPALLTTDPMDLATRPDIDIVVEVVGGIEPARSVLLAAMKNGKSVVTANKALLAEHGEEIHAASRAFGADLYYEAAVAGAIPLLRPLRESLAGDTVHRVLGIVNGTTNFILDRMDSAGSDFSESLEEAQALGYAEPDPTADVEGFDAAAKAAILASLAFHTRVTAADVYREGITEVSAADIASAKLLGRTVKLLAICERSGDGVAVRVHPAMIPRSHPLAAVGGAYNAVFVEAKSAGQLDVLRSRGGRHPDGERGPRRPRRGGPQPGGGHPGAGAVDLRGAAGAADGRHAHPVSRIARRGGPPGRARAGGRGVRPARRLHSGRPPDQQGHRGAAHHRHARGAGRRARDDGLRAAGAARRPGSGERDAGRRGGRPVTGSQAPAATGARAAWRGVITEYRDRLPVTAGMPAITLQEGGTPLLPAPVLSARTGCDVHLKVEGLNPTGSFKDRGMTVAITVAAAQGAQAVICASTGNTSASAAAYAARAGLTCAVLVPKGKIAIGKLAQALVHGAKLLQVDGSFDDCLELARKLAVDYPVALVNSVNPDRIQGQKTAAFEIVDALGDAPDIHCLPVGNAGNITAYWLGYQEYADLGLATKRPRMFGFQASGAAPIVDGAPVTHPQTIATAIRIGNPASWQLAEAARDESGGLIDKVTDREILAAYRILAREEAVWGELGSSASVAGLLAAAADGRIPAGSRVVCTITGNGLKDPDWALSGAPAPTTVPVDSASAAAALGLA